MMTAGAVSAERIYCSNRHVDNIIIKSVLRFILFSYFFLYSYKHYIMEKKHN